MQLVLDPAVVAPPEVAQRRDWVARMSDLRSLLSEQCVEGTCPSKVRDPVLARWFSSGEIDAATGELARIAGEVAARLADTVELEGSEVLLDQITTDPTYVAEAVGEAERKEFEEHLAEAGYVVQESGPHIGIFGPADSWSEPKGAVLVEASILGREDPRTGMDEPEGKEAVLRAFLPRREAVADVLEAVCADPCLLVQHLEFGVRAYYAGVLGGDPANLNFELGPELVESVAAMNYAHDPRYAAKCLRAMALIAAGRGQELDGHIERKGAGANNEYLKDEQGNKVWRSRLANQSSDANRLFWISKDIPRFLNVGGHGSTASL